ncbi:7TM GPCR, serpentine receptor class d (Srd) family-containing protein [Strongyloides ratti]|uniref:7TM GPCR, serpentine receptor class d (Srd) family-containing protein n=1 Tax=Strongyloides ratti TaxID=34506 RepID=A0A090LAY8_STRRB|nr:7TM GPCR, serpentine receptor class d (Srd) family-containing protein [Strongyloides ratti]CEF64675.1 7TM GPCR, serpentine receptor class d (Srd) family-containing protein [Strongyloides ratti]
MVILCFLFASFLVHASSEASKEEIQNKTLNEFMKKFHIKSNLFQNDNVIMGSLATLENWKFIIIDVIFFSTIYFFLIIFSLYKYTRYMKSVASKISETTKRLYLDFLRIITLQACTPFIIAFPSIVIFLITVAIGYSKNIPFLGDVLVKLLCTTPTINSMLFIFLPKKNRKRFVALFRNVITRKDSFLSSDTFNGSNHKSTYEHSTNKRKNNIVPSDVQTLRIQRKVSFIA